MELLSEGAIAIACVSYDRRGEIICPLFGSAIGVSLVFRRALYSLILVVGLLVVWINGQTYLHDVRLGMAMTSVGLLQPRIQ